MAANRPSTRLRAEITPLTQQTTESGTHVIHIFRGQNEIHRDLAASRAKALAGCPDLLRFFRDFARRNRTKRNTDGTLDR